MSQHGIGQVPSEEAFAAGKRALWIMGAVEAVTFVWVAAWLLGGPTQYSWALVVLLLIGVASSFFVGTARGRARARRMGGEVKASSHSWLPAVLAVAAAAGIAFSQWVSRGGAGASGILGVICLLILAYFGAMLMTVMSSLADQAGSANGSSERTP